MEEDENFNMVKTIIIAVCSAGAYLALVIGLTAFCSYRLLIQRRGHKGLPCEFLVFSFLFCSLVFLLQGYTHAYKDTDSLFFFY